MTKSRGLQKVTQSSYESKLANLEIANERRRAQETCVAGHPLSGDNLGNRKDGKRACKQCNRDRQNEANAAKRRQREALRRKTYGF